jgi:hypothetical protein
MVAQFTGQESPVGVNFGNKPVESPAVDTALEEPQTATESTAEPQQEAQDNGDLSSYLFNKLTQFGYPPRRLESFEDKFVKEHINREGGHEVTVVVPDRYYGKKQRISRKDLSAMIKEIEAKYGLHFIDAERDEMKLTMNFNSEDPNAEVADQQGALLDDTLSQVYGPGKEETLRTHKSSPHKDAKTLREMIKEGKKHIFAGIKGI